MDLFCCLRTVLLLVILVSASAGNDAVSFKSALGDPGMKSRKTRVHLEGWNFCNGAEQLLPSQPSPRWADCTDELCSSSGGCRSRNAVATSDNGLVTGNPFPNKSFINYTNPDLYAVEKEKYLASVCEVNAPEQQPWHFWTSMLKNGNFDLNSGICTASASSSSVQSSTRPFKQLLAQGFPCFGSGCMNQPIVQHEPSKPGRYGLEGRFYGSYDMDADMTNLHNNNSYFSVAWEKNQKTGSWIFTHELRVNNLYPWLMLYLRADATKGFSGGYPWDTRGMMVQVPESPDFTVVVTLNITKGGGPQSQFYLMDIGGCWKNNGQPCDGDVKTDVTRYSEMIINPEISSWCTPTRLEFCPPYHINSKGYVIYRNDTINFPYSAYHLYCSPSNAKYREYPSNICDPYSNPQPQELVQLLPHPEWGVHGYPTKKGQGWIGDPKTWELDVGGLSSRLYFYQDPGTPPATRQWPSIDVGTEIYVSENGESAQWTLSDFDVLISS